MQQQDISRGVFEGNMKTLGVIVLALVVLAVVGSYLHHRNEKKAAEARIEAILDDARAETARLQAKAAP